MTTCSHETEKRAIAMKILSIQLEGTDKRKITVAAEHFTAERTKKTPPRHNNTQGLAEPKWREIGDYSSLQKIAITLYSIT
jgi:hypothetical protein